MKTVMACLVLLAGPVGAESWFSTLRYLCDRAIEVPATYINADDQSFAVIHVEGSQITLLAEPAGSRARYGWPSDGAGYI